jgi:hypothetical protein
MLLEDGSDLIEDRCGPSRIGAGVERADSGADERTYRFMESHRLVKGSRGVLTESHLLLSI